MPHAPKLALPALAIVSYLAFMGNRPACDTRRLTLSCSTIDLVVPRGECVEFDNPCASAWTRQDGLRLCDQPAGLYLQTQRTPVGRRFLCASASVPDLVNAPVGYYYVRPGDLGEGNMRVTIGAGVVVSAVATPDAINPGGTAQLEAVVVGGIAPYIYQWTPALSLDDASLASPIASPDTTTEYTLTVTDTAGQVGVASVTVQVGLTVTADARPPTIALGASSQLDAAVEGGIPPYTFEWSPASSLSSSVVPDPVAAPTNSTTYALVVTDANGDTAMTTVAVQVSMQIDISATPAIIDAGDTSQLSVAVVAGGVPPFTYAWSPAASLDDPTRPDPVAQPAVSTSYSVVVTDAAGDTAVGLLQVDVVAPGGLTACFTWSEVGPGAIQLDGGCSGGGSVVQYRWWFDYQGDPSAPADRIVPGPTTFGLYMAGGDYTVRLQVVDTTGATAEVEIVITVSPT